MYNHIISTECCDKAKLHKAIKLCFVYNYGGDNVRFSEQKPIWVARGFKLDKSYYYETLVEVDRCPFCGEQCPEIVLNKDVIDNVNYNICDTDDHNYCITCNERLKACSCLPPEFRWKPIGSTIQIPNNS